MISPGRVFHCACKFTLKLLFIIRLADLYTNGVRLLLSGVVSLQSVLRLQCEVITAYCSEHFAIGKLYHVKS